MKYNILILGALFGALSFSNMFSMYIYASIFSINGHPLEYYFTKEYRKKRALEKAEEKNNKAIEKRTKKITQLLLQDKNDSGSRTKKYVEKNWDVKQPAFVLFTNRRIIPNTKSLLYHMVVEENNLDFAYWLLAKGAQTIDASSHENNHMTEDWFIMNAIIQLDKNFDNKDVLKFIKSNKNNILKKNYGKNLIDNAISFDNQYAKNVLEKIVYVVEDGLFKSLNNEKWTDIEFKFQEEE